MGNKTSNKSVENKNDKNDKNDKVKLILLNTDNFYIILDFLDFPSKTVFSRSCPAINKLITGEQYQSYRARKLKFILHNLIQFNNEVDLSLTKEEKNKITNIGNLRKSRCKAKKPWRELLVTYVSLSMAIGKEFDKKSDKQLYYTFLSFLNNFLSLSFNNSNNNEKTDEKKYHKENENKICGAILKVNGFVGYIFDLVYKHNPSFPYLIDLGRMMYQDNANLKLNDGTTDVIETEYRFYNAMQARDLKKMDILWRCGCRLDKRYMSMKFQDLFVINDDINENKTITTTTTNRDRKDSKDNKHNKDNKNNIAAVINRVNNYINKYSNKKSFKKRAKLCFSDNYGIAVKNTKFDKINLIAAYPIDLAHYYRLSIVEAKLGFDLVDFIIDRDSSQIKRGLTSALNNSFYPDLALINHYIEHVNRTLIKNVLNDIINDCKYELNISWNILSTLFNNDLLNKDSLEYFWKRNLYSIIESKDLRVLEACLINGYKLGHEIDCDYIPFHIERSFDSLFTDDLISSNSRWSLYPKLISSSARNLKSTSITEIKNNKAAKVKILKSDPLFTLNALIAYANNQKRLDIINMIDKNKFKFTSVQFKIVMNNFKSCTPSIATIIAQSIPKQELIDTLSDGINYFIDVGCSNWLRFHCLLRMIKLELESDKSILQGLILKLWYSRGKQISSMSTDVGLLILLIFLNENINNDEINDFYNLLITQTRVNPG